VNHRDGLFGLRCVMGSEGWYWGWTVSLWYENATLVLYLDLDCISSVCDCGQIRVFCQRLLQHYGT
jgi:hypothetical protein